MPEYVIRLEGLRSGPPTPYDGTYLAEYDPAAGAPGTCLLRTTHDIAGAKRYPDIVAAWEEWKRVDPRQPVRLHDGKPNRPLTAFSITVDPAPQQPNA